MTISTATHKVALANLFYEGGRERSFPLHQLKVASETLAKLMAGSSDILEEGRSVGIRFTDEPIELLVDEAKLLKDLLDGIKTATISEFRQISALKELLK